MWQLMPGYVEDLASDETIGWWFFGRGRGGLRVGGGHFPVKDKRRNMADEAEYRKTSRGAAALASLAKPLNGHDPRRLRGRAASAWRSTVICAPRRGRRALRHSRRAAGLGYHYHAWKSS